MKPLVTVVIPFYNVESYIEECINSILAQSYRDLEIICVNDGSTDNTVEVLKSKQKENRQIKIINYLENNGPGFARNTGIENANGKYLFFVDADDYLYHNTISKIVDSMQQNEVDILVYNAFAFDNETGTITKAKYFHLEEDYFCNNNVVEEYYMDLLNCTSCVLKVYNTAFLKGNNITFPTSVFGEDVEFWMKCLLNLHSIRYINYIGYARRYRKGSIMTGNSIKNYKDRIDSFDNLLDLCKNDIRLYNYVAGFYIPFTMKRVLIYGNDNLIKYSKDILNKLQNKYG